MDIHSVTVIGRRWFQKGAGNTYHSAEIHINGELVHKVAYEYGYENQYEMTAAEWMEENGLMPGRTRSRSGGAEPPRHYWDRHDVTYTASATNVGRKRDL